MNDSRAIAHALARLDKAKEAVTTMQTVGRDFPRLEAAWSDFLLAASTIYSKLEQGAKGKGQAEPWFGGIKKERKDDPLLSYIHHARNSDEHSIEEITDRTSGTITGGFVGGEIRIGGPDVPIVVKPFENFEGHIEVIGPYLALRTVTDQRYGDSFGPPKEHLGKPFTENDPITVAKAALAYLENLIAAARDKGI